MLGKKTDISFKLLAQYVEVMKIANPSAAADSLEALSQKVFFLFVPSTFLLSKLVFFILEATITFGGKRFNIFTSFYPHLCHSCAQALRRSSSRRMHSSAHLGGLRNKSVFPTSRVKLQQNSLKISLG